MDREHSSANGQVQEPAAHFPSDTSETSPEGSEGEIHAEVGSGPSSGEDLPISHSKPGLAEKTPDSGPDEHGDADASGHREEVLSDPSDRWRSYIRDYRAGKLSASSSEKSRSSLFTKTADEMIADQAVYIRCAGVVLLHPYLAHYFGKIGLVEKGDFIDEAAREKAVCLIHYLASGQTNLPEYELLLPKLLCGFPLEDPLERELVLQEAELEEGERMMQAAIDHWGVIGQASPDGLREGFLQRDGKLENKPQGWVLTVERKTIDILLNRLPFGWSISVVRLPWMKDLLKVNWI